MKDNLLYLPLKKLKEIQNRKLHRFITSYLYPFSPYYKKLFDRNKINPASIKTIRDLKIIPFTSKEAFLDTSIETTSNPTLDFILQPTKETVTKFLPKTELLKLALLGIKGKDYQKSRLEKEFKPIFLTATAGTTDKPISFLYTSYDLANLGIYGRRCIEIFGFKEDNRSVNIFPYAPHLAFWLTFYGGVTSNTFVLSTGGGKTLGTEGNIRAILKVKPQFLIGVPSYVYHILKTAKEEGIKFDFLNRIILGAGRVPKEFKLKLAGILREMGAKEIKVLGTYGFTEARSAWAECPTDVDISSGYHTYPDKEVFEIIDPDTGEVKREGEDGEIVYTGIDARGSAVLRYRTGDLAKGGIVYSPCPYCGRTVPRISSDITRASNIKSIQLSKIKGSLVNLNSLEHLLDSIHEIYEWQIEIAKKDDDPYEVDELILFVALSKEVDRENFKKYVNEEMLSDEEVTFNRIVFVSKEEIKHRIEIESAVKAKKIIDKRPVG